MSSNIGITLLTQLLFMCTNYCDGLLPQSQLINSTLNDSYLAVERGVDLT